MGSGLPLQGAIRRQETSSASGLIRRRLLGCRPCSTQSQSLGAGPTDRRSTDVTAPSCGVTRRPRADSDAPMFPSPSTAAAENAYSAAPSSQSTRMLLENGYERGIATLPSASPVAPSYSTSVARGRARLRAKDPRLTEQPVHLVKSCTSRSTGHPARLLPIHHPVVPIDRRREPMGGHGARQSQIARRNKKLQLHVLGPETQDEADHEHRMVARSGVDHCVRVAGRQGDWLLQEDVLASLERPLRPRPVKRRGQADVARAEVG